MKQTGVDNEQKNREGGREEAGSGRNNRRCDEMIINKSECVIRVQRHRNEVDIDRFRLTTSPSV